MQSSTKKLKRNINNNNNNKNKIKRNFTLLKTVASELLNSKDTKKAVPDEVLDWKRSE